MERLKPTPSVAALENPGFAKTACVDGESVGIFWTAEDGTDFEDMPWPEEYGEAVCIAQLELDGFGVEFI